MSVDNGIAYVHSDFYNGAASTSQCERLTAAIQEVGQLDTIKVVLLMGGEYSYGNGINLNTIEASADPDMVRNRSSWFAYKHCQMHVFMVFDPPILHVTSAIQLSPGWCVFGYWQKILDLNADLFGML